MKRTETAAFHYRCTICPRSLDPICIITYYRKWVKTSRTFRRSQSVRTMVLILDGNSEIGAYVRSQSRLYDLLKASDKIENSHKSYIFFLHGCATCSELPSIISTMAWSIILMILKKRYSGHVLPGQRLLRSAIIYCQNCVSKNKSTILLFYLCVCPKILVKFHVKLTIYKGVSWTCCTTVCPRSLDPFIM